MQTEQCGWVPWQPNGKKMKKKSSKSVCPLKLQLHREDLRTLYEKTILMATALVVWLLRELKVVTDL